MAENVSMTIAAEDAHGAAGAAGGNDTSIADPPADIKLATSADYYFDSYRFEYFSFLNVLRI